jgi:GNAT superfamily N-acetyltransferase
VSRNRLEPFGESHIEAAAALLADRHRASRLREPLLPESPDFAGLVAAELEDGSGTAAFADGEMGGFLIGKRRTDHLGSHVWSNPAGHAVSEPELVRDLYTHAAARWVDEGYKRHFVYAPADPSLLDPWFRLSFGASEALALRESSDPSEGGGAASAPDVTVRRSTRDDLPAVARLAAVLTSTLNNSPSFSVLPVETEDDLAAEWSDIWDPGEGYIHFVAEMSGEVVGHTLLHRRQPDLRVPQDSIDLGNAATDPELRGTGIGVAMTRHVLAWAHENGYPTMTTSWRMTNLLAARFWPRRGFREAFIRLYRSIP